MWIQLRTPEPRDEISGSYKKIVLSVRTEWVYIRVGGVNISRPKMSANKDVGKRKKIRTLCEEKNTKNGSKHSWKTLIMKRSWKYTTSYSTLDILNG